MIISRSKGSIQITDPAYSNDRSVKLDRDNQMYEEIKIFYDVSFGLLTLYCYCTSVLSCGYGFAGRDMCTLMLFGTIMCLWLQISIPHTIT
jgi:hypothetical protein